MAKSKIEKTNAYVLGGGGREALSALLLSRSAIIGDVYVGPGNGGTREFAINTPVIPDFPHCREFIKFLKDEGIKLVVSGSENDLIKGVGDIVRMHDIDFVGASGAIAKGWEGTKGGSRDFMAAQGMPHPRYMVFDSGNFAEDVKRAMGYGESRLGYNDVEGLAIKADGTCGGKGVTLVRTMAEFEAGLNKLPEFKAAGERFVVEDIVPGVELSLTVLVGNKGEYLVLPYTQDYKPAGNGDTGGMTGGMGAVTVDIPASLDARIRDEILIPTLEGAHRMKTPTLECSNSLAAHIPAPR